MQKKIAFVISRIFGPIPLLFALWLTTALKSGIGFWKALWVYPIILFFSLLIPTVITTYLITVKKVSDIEWKRIANRRKFLIPLGIYSITVLSVLTYLLTNSTIFHLTLLFSTICATFIVIYAFTNFKISAHIAVATITIANTNLFFGLKYLWLFILLIPIIWARYVLKVHTLAELISGFALTASMLLLGLFLFGWPAVP